MPFKAGVKEAAKILAGLDFKQREKILEIIAKKDPRMGDLLRENLVTIDDLQYATVKMLQELLREIKITDLALALRLANSEVQQHILNSISKSMREEIVEVLNGPPLPLEKVRPAYQRVLGVIREKVERGELVLKEGGEELV